MSLNLKDRMAKYELRLSGQLERQTALHESYVPARTNKDCLTCISENATPGRQVYSGIAKAVE